MRDSMPSKSIATTASSSRLFGFRVVLFSSGGFGTERTVTDVLAQRHQ